QVTIPLVFAGSMHRLVQGAQEHSAGAKQAPLPSPARFGKIHICVKSNATVGVALFSETISWGCSGCWMDHVENRHHFYLKKTENDADSPKGPCVQTPCFWE
ncbi:unnamed protein product, partial [Sphacelaria rigidula]